jgi:ribosomal protein S27E
MKCRTCGSELDQEPVADPQIDFIRILCGECEKINQKSLTRELEKES